MLVLDVTVINVALPGIRASLGFSSTGLAWVTSAYTLTFGGLLLLGGRAGDLFGRRRLFMVGISLFTLGSLAGGLATSAGGLLAARVLQGIGAAAAGPSTIALVATTVTEPRARIRALALLSAMSSAGFAIGLVVGGVLTAIGSWRWVLFINVPFGVAAVALAPRYVRESQRQPASLRELDLPGAVTASLGVGALVYGLLHAASAGWAALPTRLFLAAGLVALGAFILIEQRSPRPLLPLRLFADRDRATAYANFLLGPVAMMSTFFFLTQYLQEVRSMGALATGFAFLPLAAGIFAMTRLVPRLLPRFGARPLTTAGAVLMLAGLILLTRLSTDSAYLTAIAPAMVLLGLGGGLAFVPLAPVIMTSVAPAESGVAGGVLQTMQQVGASLGLATLVTVFGHALASAAGQPPASQLTAGVTSVFPYSAAVAVAIIVVASGFRPAAGSPRSTMDS
jgi:EmrB/QacA subfamily drug resistance transporter